MFFPSFEFKILFCSYFITVRALLCVFLEHFRRWSRLVLSFVTKKSFPVDKRGELSRDKSGHWEWEGTCTYLITDTWWQPWWGTSCSQWHLTICIRWWIVENAAWVSSWRISSASSPFFHLSKETYFNSASLESIETMGSCRNQTQQWKSLDISNLEADRKAMNESIDSMWFILHRRSWTKKSARAAKVHFRSLNRGSIYTSNHIPDLSTFSH